MLSSPAFGVKTSPRGGRPTFLDPSLNLSEQQSDTRPSGPHRPSQEPSGRAAALSRRHSRPYGPGRRGHLASPAQLHAHAKEGRHLGVQYRQAHGLRQNSGSAPPGACSARPAGLTFHSNPPRVRITGSKVYLLTTMVNILCSRRIPFRSVGGRSLRGCPVLAAGEGRVFRSFERTVCLHPPFSYS